MTEKQRKLESEIAYVITVKTTLEEEKENVIIWYNRNDFIGKDEMKKTGDMRKVLTKSLCEIALMNGKIDEMEEHKKGEQTNKREYYSWRGK
jgi:hypothetical protein